MNFYKKLVIFIIGFLIGAFFVGYSLNDGYLSKHEREAIKLGYAEFGEKLEFKWK